MEKQVMVKNIDQVARQRNFLLFLVISKCIFGCCS